MADLWQLATAVNLRPEAFGGMAFQRERGITIEVDGEAYDLLCRYLAPRPLPPGGGPAARLVPQLVQMGFLVPVEGPPRPVRPVPVPSWLGDGYTLSAPEVVHLTITTRCNRSCPGCYVPQPATETELASRAWCDLIDQWAQMGVFQLAVGGGEPLLYEGLFDVLAYARARGIVPSMTTNATLLDQAAARRLEEAGVGRINVSWNSPRGDGTTHNQAALQALPLLRGTRLQVGVNLLVTPAVLPQLASTLGHLEGLGVRRVTVLRPKPPLVATGDNRAWYEANRLRRGDLGWLQAIMRAWSGRLELEVDSALVGLMGESPAELLRRRAIHGCAAGRRLCTVWPDGRVTPCSFLADSAGNACRTPFAELWQRGENWERLRDVTARPQRGCTGCAIVQQCGGVRCIARYEGRDLLAGDEACPHF